MSLTCQEHPVAEMKGVSALVDAFPLPAAVLTMEGAVVRANASFRQMNADQPGFPPPESSSLWRRWIETVAGAGAAGLDRQLPFEEGASAPVRVRLRLLPTEPTCLLATCEPAEHRYRDSLDTSADLICVTDLQGDIIYVNEMWRRRMGRGQTEIAGTNSLVYVRPEFHTAYREALQQAASGQRVEAVRFTAQTKDGGSIDILTHFVPMLDANGAVAQVLASGRDITELQRAREELKSSEERLRVLFEYAPDAHYLMDLMGTFLDVNRAAEELCGYAKEEIIGKSFLKMGILSPKQLPRAAGYMAQSAMGRSIGPVELLLKRKDGTHIHVEIRTHPVRVGGRDVVLGTARDVSDRRKAEAALRDSEEKFKVIFEEAGEGIAYLDDGGRVLDSNKKVQEILGRSAEELAGKHLLELGILDAGNIPEIMGRLQQVLLGTREPLALCVTNKQGRQLHLECTASAVQCKGGSHHVVVLMRDVTESRRAAEHQAQLVRQLSEINQELRDFAHIVSHDLKAPLRGTRVLAEWLTADYQDKLDAQGKENLRLLNGRLNHMQNLIDGILQYSRVGRAEENVTFVDLGQLLREVVENLDVPSCISMQIQPGLPTVQADATRITQVFQNLLSNAIKYMDKPQGEVRVMGEDRGDCWEFRVADNGPGIEQKYFERIFKIFQTLTPKDAYESTGLGLTLTKKIVELYGGRIWVESTIGQGSTFFFTWPKEIHKLSETPEPASISS
jgi:two-component system, LuxR family, sensor kinase FixL